jgi:hypothetical protein
MDRSKKTARIIMVGNILSCPNLVVDGIFIPIPMLNCCLCTCNCVVTGFLSNNRVEAQCGTTRCQEL